MIGIFIILGQLIYLKYSNLFLNTINKVCRLFNFKYKIDLVNKTSLIGISYYSLIMISYLIDIYRGTCKAQKTYLNVLCLCLIFQYYHLDHLLDIII